MVRYSTLFILCLLFAANLHAEDEKPSLELIKFLADWEQDDDVWIDSDTSNPTATTEQEADDESNK